MKKKIIEGGTFVETDDGDEPIRVERFYDNETTEEEDFPSGTEEYDRGEGLFDCD